MKFHKMHGLGNDYIIIDNRDESLENETIEKLTNFCRRRFSVGADGLLLVCHSNTADMKMRIFNNDGSEAEMCGNGIRCFAKYCYDNNLVNNSHMLIETRAGIKECWIEKTNGKQTIIKVDMGNPMIERFDSSMKGEGKFLNDVLFVDGLPYKASFISMGNPHCIIFVDNLEGFPLEELGPKIEHHELFPSKTNVEFIQVLNRTEIKMRVWERGVGETLACGTGACASVVAAYLLNRVEQKVIVHLLGGDLEIEFMDRVFMKGPAEVVFEGIIHIW